MRTFLYSNSTSKKKNILPPVVGCFLITLLIVILAIIILHLIPHSKPSSTSQATTSIGGSQNSDKGQPTTENSNQTSNSSEQPGDNKGNNGGTASTSLVAPWGDFVSAHVGIKGSTPLASVCNTTPGASCEITFTDGSTTKNIAMQTADRNGSVYWNSWTPDSIGLYPGSWTVQAIASLNNTTKTATDASALEIVQ